MDHSKQLIIGVTIGFTIYAIYKIFFSKKSQNTPPTPQPQQNSPTSHTKQAQKQHKNNSSGPNSRVGGSIGVQRQLCGLKITSESSLQQCKKATQLIFKYTLSKIMEFNHSQKIKRNLAIQSYRNCEGSIKKRNCFQNYLHILVQGLQQSRQIAIQSKNKAYQLLSTNGEIFAKYSTELGPFKSQLKQKSLTVLEQTSYQGQGSHELTQTQLAEVIDLLISFYSSQKARKLINSLLQATEEWGPERKALLLKALSLIVIDTVLTQSEVTKYGQIDEMELQACKMAYHKELEHRLQILGKYEQQFYENATGQMMMN